tara:strand:- start:702 stop:884 length:183 start_codon:yes stop_codon:yes gene_type:complete
MKTNKNFSRKKDKEISGTGIRLLTQSRVVAKTQLSLIIPLRGLLRNLAISSTINLYQSDH